MCHVKFRCDNELCSEGVTNRRGFVIIEGASSWSWHICENAYVTRRICFHSNFFACVIQNASFLFFENMDVFVHSYSREVYYIFVLIAFIIMLQTCRFHLTIPHLMLKNTYISNIFFTCFQRLHTTFCWSCRCQLRIANLNPPHYIAAKSYNQTSLVWWFGILTLSFRKFPPSCPKSLSYN